MSTSPARIDAMDGVRGWAALSVAGYHFLWETFGLRFPELRNPLVGSLLNGPLAVSIFFVLSGYVLTVHGWGSPDKSRTVRLMAKRYTRLAIPVLAASSLVLVLMALGLVANREAAIVVRREDWLGAWLQFPADLGDMLRYALCTVFLNERGHGYGPFLWTMTIELWGSLLVLGICLLERRLRRPATLLAVLAAYFLVVDPPWSGFFFGALIALGHRRGWLPHGMPGARTAILAGATVAAMLLIAGIAVWVAAEGSALQYLLRRVVDALVAPVVIVAVCWSRGLSGASASPLSRLLGRLSFPLYLVHFAVLVSLTSHLVVAAEAAGDLTLPVAIGIATLSVAVSLVAAAAFQPVETATTAVGNWIAARLPRTPAPSPLAVPGE